MGGQSSGYYVWSQAWEVGTTRGKEEVSVALRGFKSRDSAGGGLDRVVYIESQEVILLALEKALALAVCCLSGEAD